MSTEIVVVGPESRYIKDVSGVGGWMGMYLSREQSCQMTPAHCRAARAWLTWTQADLSRRSQVGLSAIKDFEAGNRKTLPAIRWQLQQAFDRAGVVFLPDGIEVEELDQQGVLALPDREIINNCK